MELSEQDRKAVSRANRGVVPSVNSRMVVSAHPRQGTRGVRRHVRNGKHLYVVPMVDREGSIVATFSVRDVSVENARAITQRELEGMQAAGLIGKGIHVGRVRKKFSTLTEER